MRETNNEVGPGNELVAFEIRVVSRSWLNSWCKKLLRQPSVAVSIALHRFDDKNSARMFSRAIRPALE